MTDPHEALAEGQLEDAIAVQEAAVQAARFDPIARRFLIDLLAFAARWDDVYAHLDVLDGPNPEGSKLSRGIRQLFQAQGRRSTSEALFPQYFHPHPLPLHLRNRWEAVAALRQSRQDDAMHLIDVADASTPEVRGFVDGREFEGLRDADDRFASLLEVVNEDTYGWYGWESIRKVELAPAAVLLDQLLRPATLTLIDGTVVAVHLPLVYPDSHLEDGVFALGMDTDWVCPDGGPTRCVGGKLLLVGDEDEVPLRDCRMIELR